MDNTPESIQIDKISMSIADETSGRHSALKAMRGIENQAKCMSRDLEEDLNTTWKKKTVARVLRDFGKTPKPSSPGSVILWPPCPLPQNEACFPGLQSTQTTLLATPSTMSFYLHWQKTTSRICRATSPTHKCSLFITFFSKFQSLVSTRVMTSTEWQWKSIYGEMATVRP